MSYCLNPTCTHPHNPDTPTQCQTCGSLLRLQNRYLPLRPLGQGGFGTTFLATDLADSLRSPCVIKQALPPARTPLSNPTSPPPANPLHQEALELERLGSHPQIPQFIAYLEQEDRQYLVQEWIDGDNLAQELASHGPWDEPQIRHLLLDLLPVVQFMHDRHIIHRDIKPANIIRRRSDQRFALVDLGAAKYAAGLMLGQTGTVIGSAEYTAPEQMRGKAIFASDLYSLGVTCLHLLTDLSPFDLFDSSENRWVWQPALSHPISPELATVLDRLIATATKHRYPSAAAVLQDLKHQPALPLSSPQPERPAPATRSPGSRLARASHPRRVPQHRRGASSAIARPSTLQASRTARSLELAQGSQILFKVIPLMIGGVALVSWLGGTAQSSLPTVNPPAAPPTSIFHTAPHTAPIPTIAPPLEPSPPISAPDGGSLRARRPSG